MLLVTGNVNCSLTYLTDPGFAPTESAWAGRRRRSRRPAAQTQNRVFYKARKVRRKLSSPPALAKKRCSRDKPCPGLLHRFECACREKRENRGTEAHDALARDQHGPTEDVGINLIENVAFLGNASGVDDPSHLHAMFRHAIQD